ncbi:MAG: cytochrome c biogenesis protein CcsA [Verrucomicrobia bacterium]|nr:cytochrome c biogenesis protein CcsA [Verrucomicrobiota bacterium]
MKKSIPWILFAVFALEAAVALRPRGEKDFHFRAFGELPVLLNGRVQPLDSVARNSLLQIRSAQAVPLEGNGADGSWGEWNELRKNPKAAPFSERKWWQFSKHPRKLKPSAWLLEVMTNPDLADERPVFLVHHPELLSQLKLEEKGVENSGLRYYTFNEIRSVWPEVEKQAQQIRGIEPEAQTALQKQVAKLENALILYHRLKNSLQPEGTKDFSAQIAQFQKAITPGIAAVRAQSAGKDYDKEAFERLLGLLGPYDLMANLAYPFLVPPAQPEVSRDNWTQIGLSLMETARSGELHPAVSSFAALATAYRQGKVDEFNFAVENYRAWLTEKFVPELKKGERESFFNNYSPFYRAMLIYIVAFLLGCASWFGWSETWRRSAVYLVSLALVIHTTALLFRMFLEGRPPVTNLYSSAIFIGWGAAVLGLVLERIFRDGVGAVVASFVGFVTLIIAHNLALGGDTMEMLRAVLDTNFWLATHVTTVTLGYASTFVAGFLATIYILRGVFTRTLSEATAKALARMVYGIVCFATLFSFVGTILGGIWADQSWGRFWGWDPKENGALIIVIWNAMILHARWGGMVRERGLMNMAIFGNIVTSFSWFGVNMLGIGLHSYGFMDAAFKWLMLFVGSQVLLIALGLLPMEKWSSRQSLRAAAPVGAAVS